MKNKIADARTATLLTIAIIGAVAAAIAAYFWGYLAVILNSPTEALVPLMARIVARISA